jgi:RNA polymerase sigma-70 factor (ECF subfamily)
MIFRRSSVRRWKHWKRVLPAPAQAARNRAADVELAARCRAGEPAAWEYLVRQYSRRVYHLAYKFVGRHEQAEDLTQEVFLKIYRSLDQYNPEVGDFPNWLSTPGAQSHH